MSKPHPAMLAVFALGAFWYMSKAKGQTGGLGGAFNSIMGNPRYGTDAATRAPATLRYMIPPSGTLPAGTVQSAGVSLLQSVLKMVGGSSGGAAASMSGLPAVVNAANPYGFDAVQAGGVGLENAYSFGGPSMGVYGSTSGATPSAPYGTGPVGVVLGPNADYYGTITNPATFTGDPYNDGAGYVDAMASSPRPNYDWDMPTGQDLSVGW